VLQTIRRLLIRSRGFRLERELPGGICTHDINAPWQGTQWNKIEHKLFSYISINWRGKPLRTFNDVVSYILATTTGAGLIVEAEIDTNIYEKGIKIPDKELRAINMTKHDFHGEWNYTISPTSTG
jgi:hypothetical protein